MARDSIELTQYEPVPSREKSRASSSRSEETPTQRSAINLQSDQDDRSRARVPQDRRAQSRAAALHDEDDSELLINREDLDLDGEEAQFLRTNRRVPVRRNA